MRVRFVKDARVTIEDGKEKIISETHYRKGASCEFAAEVVSELMVRGAVVPDGVQYGGPVPADIEV